MIAKRGVLVYTSTARLQTSLGAGKLPASTYYLSSTTYLPTIHLTVYCNMIYASFLRLLRAAIQKFRLEVCKMKKIENSQTLPGHRSR